MQGLITVWVLGGPAVFAAFWLAARTGKLPPLAGWRKHLLLAALFAALLPWILLVGIFTIGLRESPRYNRWLTSSAAVKYLRK